MSCMFTAGGDVLEVDQFVHDFAITPHQIWRRGELRRFGKRRPYLWSGFSFVASDADFNQFDQQVEDVIAFIEKNVLWLEVLIDVKNLEFATFDFGIEIPDGTVIPSVYFPPNLVKAAGRIGLGLEASLYYCLSDESSSKS